MILVVRQARKCVQNEPHRAGGIHERETSDSTTSVIGSNVHVQRIGDLKRIRQHERVAFGAQQLSQTRRRELDAKFIYQENELLEIAVDQSTCWMRIIMTTIQDRDGNYMFA